MKRLLTMLICVMALLASSSIAYAQMQWRETNRDINATSLTDPRLTDGVEIFGKDGAIIIRTQHRIQVRVFTILGQLVSQTVLSSGTSELRIGSRGIYIVKIGNTTQKVAL